MVVEDKLVYHEGLGLAVGPCLGLIYSDNIMVGSQDLEWIQGKLNVIIGLFQRYGLAENVFKYKAMAFHPGEIRSRMSEEAVGRGCTVKGETYICQLRRRIPCTDCGVELTAVLMTAQQWCMYGTEPNIKWNWLPVNQTEHITQVFEVSFPKGASQSP